MELLNDNAIIVMGNVIPWVMCHSVKKDPIPTISWKKNNIIE